MYVGLDYCLMVLSQPCVAYTFANLNWCRWFLFLDELPCFLNIDQHMSNT